MRSSFKQRRLRVCPSSSGPYEVLQAGDPYEVLQAAAQMRSFRQRRPLGANETAASEALGALSTN